MSELKQPETRRILPITFAVTFLGFLDTHLLIPILALYASELGARVGIIGLIVGLYSITNVPANILFGRLIDRVGYKVPLIGGLIGDALSMLLYSVSRLPVHLALVRAFHGVSGGLVGPATMSVTADYSEKAGKGRAMGFYGMSLGAAVLVGYGMSGMLVSRLGYRALFLFGATVLAIGVMLSFALPGNRRKHRGAAGISLGEGARRALDLLGRKELFVSYCSIFAQYFTFGGVVTLLPLYIRSLGMGAFHVGMLLATFAVVFIIIQFPTGVLSDRIGRLMPVAAGLGLGAASLAVMPVLGTFALLAAAMALYGIAYGLIFPSISALIADHTATEERGTATGIFHALLTAGVAIGAPIMGLVGEMLGVGLGLASNAGIMLMALAIALESLKRGCVHYIT